MTAEFKLRLPGAARLVAIMDGSRGVGRKRRIS
jgi:hypothetical protein